MKKISTILADDHGILRFGLRVFIDATDDINVIGEAAKGAECIKLFEEKRPDICLIDIRMPNMNGIEVAQTILDIDPKAKIIFLSMHTDEPTLKKALSVNVHGYLCKDTSKHKILEAIRSVHSGQKVFSDCIPEKMLEPNGNTQPEGLAKNITKREMEIISLVVAGYSSPQIADKLYISRRTVDTHRNNIMQKLNISNTASLVRLALENDLVDSSPAYKSKNT